jgi:hypothetical protein
MYSNDAGQTSSAAVIMNEDREIHRTPFWLKEVRPKIHHDHVHVSPTVKHNLHRSTEADRLSTVAANHEQETNDHHGHHGHLVHGGLIAFDAAAGGTGRLLHLFG